MTGRPRSAAAAAKRASGPALSIDSTNSVYEPISGSSRVASQISPRVRSTSEPVETNPAKPRPRAFARVISAPMTLPDWDATNDGPTGRSGSANAALAVSSMPLRGLTTPMLFGPTTRTPYRRATSSSSSSRSRPSGPPSPKPPDSTVTSGTPASPHSRTVSTTRAVSVRTKTWSGTSGSEAMSGQARSPSTVSRRGLTG